MTMRRSSHFLLLCLALSVQSTFSLVTRSKSQSTQTRTALFSHPENHRNKNFLWFRQTKNAFQGGLAVIVLSASLGLGGSPAIASDYGSLTVEQKAVAEAWRLVDNSFIDRTFNNQDWFQLRQDNIKRKYKSMNEAQDAITIMLGKLGDKYTRYLSPAKYQSLVDSATGTLAGVGVEIATNKEGRIMASDIEPNSPASSAGIMPKDIFVEVDGARFDTTSTPDDVAVKLRGPVGSKVGVVMERDGKTLDFIVTRQSLKITSVRSYMTDKPGVNGKIGVIRIKSFSGTTAETVKSELADLQKKGATNIVVDLRGNPGGLLPGGVDTAALFLDANAPVVFVADKKGVVDSQATLSVGVDLDDPLVLVVDGNTASAAEVFAAALQENGRATLVGEQTFGKGIVQTVKPMSNDNGGVAVTVARYETPKHNNINKRGIPVDIPASVDCPKDDVSSCLPANAFRKPQGV